MTQVYAVTATKVDDENPNPAFTERFDNKPEAEEYAKKKNSYRSLFTHEVAEMIVPTIDWNKPIKYRLPPDETPTFAPAKVLCTDKPISCDQGGPIVVLAGDTVWFYKTDGTPCAHRSFCPPEILNIDSD